MTDLINVRPMLRTDLPAIAPVLEATGLFPSNMLADMAAPFLDDAAPHIWLVATIGRRLCGFAYCEPERATQGTFNLLAIAVAPGDQGQGVGSTLVASLEARLRTDAARVLIVETSALDAYADSRAFYLVRGFSEEARIRDFYDEGEHKVIFWKHL